MQKTREEKIDDALKRRIENTKKALNAEDSIEALNELTLYLSKTTVCRWGLSLDDYFEFEYDEESKRLIGISYHYNFSWRDSGERIIPVNSKEFRLLEKLFYEVILIK